MKKFKLKKSLNLKIDFVSKKSLKSLVIKSIHLQTGKPGVKAVILYTHDESAVGSSVVTMQVDQETFMNVIKNSQTRFLDAKPLRFIQDNGFFDLLEGDSTAFSFATSSGMADCDCKCSRRATTTTTTTTTTTPKPIIITTSRPITTPRFDPVSISFFCLYSLRDSLFADPSIKFLLSGLTVNISKSSLTDTR